MKIADNIHVSHTIFWHLSTLHFFGFFFELTTETAAAFVGAHYSQRANSPDLEISGSASIREHT